MMVVSSDSLEGGDVEGEQRRIIRASRRISRRREFERLTRNLLPLHYEIFIEPDYTTCDTYNGITTIRVNISEVTRRVQFHAFGFDVLEVTYEDEASKIIKRSVDIIEDDQNEIVTAEFDSGIPPGIGTFSILYIGPISDQMKGFFRTSYRTPDGENRYAFGTYFEPTYARHAFPCMDEPHFKATFDISLVVPANRIAISNMPIIKDSPHEMGPGNYRILKFQTTPVMSTYLVSFAIGEYEVLEGKAKSDIPIRAYTPLGRRYQGEFALDAAIRCVDFFSEYFEIPFPLPKLDMVPFPTFSSGAMESWGFISMRETVYLVDPDESSAIVKQWTAHVIAHNIAHQWFGNLVTMSWWSDLWLNKGFASFCSYLAVNHIYPQLDVWTQFPVDVLIPALELDGLCSSHPVEMMIQDPSDIPEVFDAISFCKGASLVYMLHSYMAPQEFRKGISSYLSTHAYGSTTTVELWKSLEDSCALPIVNMMRIWIERKGFPLIKIADVEHRSGSRAITLTQEKFCSNPKYNGDKVEFRNYIWIIPLIFTKQSQPDTPTSKFVMDGNESCIMDFLIPDILPSEWLKINSNISGFYRVHYPSSHLEQFYTSIRNRTMAPLDRLNLLDDLYALVRTGESSTVELLKLMNCFEEEDSYIVWQGMDRVIGGIKELLDFTDIGPKFCIMARNLIRPIRDRLGWEASPSEDHLTGLFRTSVLVRLSLLDDEDTLVEGMERFLYHLTKERIISPDLRSPAYRAALATGDCKVFESLVSMYRETDFPEEKVRILRTMGSAREPEMMDHVLAFALTEEVKAQDLIPLLLNMVSTSKEGKERAWEFFKVNVTMFREKFPMGQLFNGFLKHLLGGFCSEEMALQVEAFFNENSFNGTRRCLEQIVETIRIHSEWERRDANAIRAFLSSY